MRGLLDTLSGMVRASGVARHHPTGGGVLRRCRRATRTPTRTAPASTRPPTSHHQPGESSAVASVDSSGLGDALAVGVVVPVATGMGVTVSVTVAVRVGSGVVVLV